ncbi:NAD(P)H-binding protein [Lentzea sp. PSKA42]|uniref:NAD(P)H-binding protein n=1 Tax=Lentzea indica TaxID=2604800 RepID=A0ABX1FIK7_9PSEU|nr:NAD(P)H-binding protein [Lentzea indica]NKE58765.1 NAD(P)H-binding protein [Lentzea indica]
MILVTGATGNIGSVLLEELRVCGAGAVRGRTRDVARAKFPAGVEAVEGDLTHAGGLDLALEGVRSLFLLQGFGAEAEVLEAARQAGVEHVVLVSSITVETHPHLPAAQANRAAEELLKASGLAWTILRPTQFASNTVMWAPSIRDHGTVRAPYPDTGLPAIDPSDIAAVARAALTEPGHRGRIHPLSGPRRVTPREQVADIAAALGRELSFVEISREEAHQELASHLGDEIADAVLDLTGGDVNDELLAVRDTVERVTGRPATPFSQWATENVAAFR